MLTTQHEWTVIGDILTLVIGNSPLTPHGDHSGSGTQHARGSVVEQYLTKRFMEAADKRQTSSICDYASPNKLSMARSLSINKSGSRDPNNAEQRLFRL